MLATRVKLAAVVISALGTGHSALGAVAGPPGPGTAIVEVDVIPMSRDGALRRQTVLVRDGRIERLGPADQLTVPPEYDWIDGRGKYLMPGLIDMHVHSDYQLPDSLAPDELFVMTANGVTTARLMIGTPEPLALRSAVQAGRLVGPRLFVGSPQLSGRSFGDIFNGRVVTTPAAARAAVREVKSLGYDFVKVTFFISRPVYDAIVEEARRADIRVAGHVDGQVGLERVLATGQQIEHLDGMLEAVVADSAPIKSSVSGVNVWGRQHWQSLDHIDDAKIPQVAAAVALAGVWNTPTLTFLKKAFGEGQSDEEIRARPDWRFIAPLNREEMEGPRKAFWSNPPSESSRRRYVEVRNRLVKALPDAGARIMAGSDAPEWFLTYGLTLHRELESLVAAGLPPWAALRAATATPAEWLGFGIRSGRSRRVAERTWCCWTPTRCRTSGTPSASPG